ncbi:unnamed protein product, partial [Nesidiocoris tenuis]
MYRCPEFLQLPLNQRRSAVLNAGVCPNCLGGIHEVSKCRSNYSCRTCQGRHHFFLHDFGPHSTLPDDTIARATRQQVAAGASRMPSPAAFPDAQEKDNQESTSDHFVSVGHNSQSPNAYDDNAHEFRPISRAL